MSTHAFPNKPIKVVVFNGENHFENYCQCGYRADGLDTIAVSLQEKAHFEESTPPEVAKLFRI